MDIALPQPEFNVHRRFPLPSKQQMIPPPFSPKTYSPPGDVAQEGTPPRQSSCASFLPSCLARRTILPAFVPTYMDFSVCQPNMMPPVLVCQRRRPDVRP